MKAYLIKNNTDDYQYESLFNLVKNNTDDYQYDTDKMYEDLDKINFIKSGNSIIYIHNMGCDIKIT